MNVFWEYIAIIIGMIIAMIFNCIGTYLIGRSKGFYVKNLRIFGLCLTKAGDKYVWHREKFIFLIYVTMYSDTGETDEIITKILSRILVITGVISLIATVQFMNPEVSSDEFVVCISWGFSVYCIILSVMMNYVKKSQMMKLLEECIEQLKKISDFADLDLEIDDIVCGNAGSKLDGEAVYRCSLLKLYFYKAYALKDYAGMDLAIEYEKKFLPKRYVHGLHGIYQNIVFYHSYFKKESETARKYYNLAKFDIENDKDVNGRRILAYYQYYIENDVVKAAKTLEQAEYELEHANRKLFTGVELIRENHFIELLRKEMASG